MLKKGDKIYIYPSYNFDRTERKLVEVESVTKSTENSKVPGSRIKFKEPAKATIEDVNKMIENGEITKTCE